jgi:hypothetical protein
VGLSFRTTCKPISVVQILSSGSTRTMVLLRTDRRRCCVGICRKRRIQSTTAEKPDMEVNRSGGLANQKLEHPMRRLVPAGFLCA